MGPVRLLKVLPLAFLLALPLLSAQADDPAAAEARKRKVEAAKKVFGLSDYAKMRGRKKVMVYTASTLLMALDAMDNPQAKEESEVKRDRYGTTVTSKKTPCKYPAADQALVEELAKFLRDSQVSK